MNAPSLPLGQTTYCPSQNHAQFKCPCGFAATAFHILLPSSIEESFAHVIVNVASGRMNA